MLPRFLIVGLLGFIVDAGLTHLFMRAGASPLLARPPATALAILCTWLANRSYTFAYRKERSWAELMRYAAVAVTGFALNIAAYSALVLAGLWPFAAIVVASILVMAFSFFGYRRFAFPASQGGAAR